MGNVATSVTGIFDILSAVLEKNVWRSSPKGSERFHSYNSRFDNTLTLMRPEVL